jgi:hypothetical protein
MRPTCPGDISYAEEGCLLDVVRTPDTGLSVPFPTVGVENWASDSRRWDRSNSDFKYSIRTENRQVCLSDVFKKEKALPWSRSAGLQLPLEVTTQGRSPDSYRNSRRCYKKPRSGLSPPRSNSSWRRPHGRSQLGNSSCPRRRPSEAQGIEYTQKKILSSRFRGLASQEMRNSSPAHSAFYDRERPSTESCFILCNKGLESEYNQLLSAVRDS